VPLLNSLYRSGLWIAGPVFGLGLALLVFSIAGVSRAVRRAEITSVTLAERQELEFPAAGRVILCSESPRLSRRFAGLGYALVGPGGAEIVGRRVAFRTVRADFGKVRMAYAEYILPRAGHYVLEVRGLPERYAPDERFSVAFMRPYLGRSMAGVAGILVSAFLLIGSLVLFFLRLLDKAERPRGGTEPAREGP
jgi:hypothetical protein